MLNLNPKMPNLYRLGIIKILLKERAPSLLWVHWTLSSYARKSKRFKSSLEKTVLQKEGRTNKDGQAELNSLGSNRAGCLIKKKMKTWYGNGRIFYTIYFEAAYSQNSQNCCFGCIFKITKSPKWRNEIILKWQLRPQKVWYFTKASLIILWLTVPYT